MLSLNIYQSPLSPGEWGDFYIPLLPGINNWMEHLTKSFCQGAFLKSVLPSACQDMQKHTLGYDMCKHKLSHSGSAWNWGEHHGTGAGSFSTELMWVSHPCMLGEPLPWGQEGCLCKGHLHWGLWLIITSTRGSTFPNFQSCPISLFFAFFFSLHWISVYS